MGDRKVPHPWHLDEQLHLTTVPRDVVRDLHQHPLVLPHGHDVGEHPDQLVQPVRLLGKELGGGEEALGGFYLSLAPREVLHAGGHAHHVASPF